MNSTIDRYFAKFSDTMFEMMNGADGISDIEGKATRVGASERGQRTSFNGADGISDIEGKVARVATSKLGNERVSKFNIRAFHDAVLELSSVPLPVVTARIDRFIAEGGKGPYPDME